MRPTGVLRIEPGLEKDVSVAGVGFRPRGLLLWWSLQETAGTVAANMGGIGLADDSGCEAAVAWAADGEAASDVVTTWGDDCALLGYDHPQSGAVALRGHVSWSDDGFALSWPPSGRGVWHVHYLAFGGDGVRAGVRTVQVERSRVPVVDDLGFAPDLLVLLSGAGAGGGCVSRIVSVVGVAVPQAQASAGFVASVHDRKASVRGAQRLDAAVALPGLSPAFEVEALTRVAAFHEGGFTLETATAHETSLAVLAVGGGTFRVGTIVSPSLPGRSEITLDFDPSTVLAFTWGLGASEDVKDIGRLSLGAASSSTNQHALSWAVRNRDSWPLTPWARSTADGLIDVLDTRTGTLHASAAVADVHARGFTLDWPVADVARECVYVAIGLPLSDRR